MKETYVKEECGCYSREIKQNMDFVVTIIHV
jgi:hypothetical protein